MLKDFQLVGRGLFTMGINNSHSGNLSVCSGDKIVITRRGSMLAHLEDTDLIETGLREDDPQNQLVSREIGVHRSIYLDTSAKAIVHAHPVFATALSLLKEEIIPIDAEGRYLLNKIPVLDVGEAIGSEEVAEKIPALLKEHKIAMVKGHGSFAVGDSLEEAYQSTTSLENVCKIIYYTTTLEKYL